MDSNRPSNSSVASLTGARIPADHGMSSLGLLMQLVGSSMFGVMAFLAVMPIFAGGSAMSWPLFLLGGSGATRAIYHRMAGTGLIQGSPKGPFAGVRAYLIASVVETAVWIYVFKSQFHMPGSAVVSLAIAQLAWPAALAGVMAWPKLRRYEREGLPMSEDMGFEGAAVLMTLLGVIGVIVAGLMVLALIKAPGKVLASGPGLLLFGVMVMMLVRACLHAAAGIRGTRGLDSDGATEAATRYYNFGVVSSVIAGGALMIQLMMTALHPAMLLMVAMVVYLLLAWPLLLRTFFTERNFVTMLAGKDAPVFRRAPDAGLTALGWVLLASAVYGLSLSLPQALFGADGISADFRSLLSMGGSGGFDEAAAASRSAWWGVGTAALQLWAAIELIAMTDRHKTAATVFGVAATLAALYVTWPMIKDMNAMVGLAGRSGGMDGIMQFMMIAAQLVLPIGTVVLVNRAVTPVAQARVVDSGT